jgi:hypothetical protein
VRYFFFLFCLLIVTASCSDKRSTQSAECIPLASPALQLSAEPYVVTVGEAVLMSWVQKTESGSMLWYSLLRDTTWSAPMVIDSGSNWFVNWADYPMMAANGENFIAHYLARSGPSKYAYDIILSSSVDKGATWHPRGKLNDDGKQAEHGFVSMLPYGDGFIISWLDGRNAVMEGAEGHEEHGDMTLRAAIVNAQGSKINEWELDNRTCDCCQTTVAVTNSGPVVIYRDRSDDEIRDMSIVRYVDGQWTSPKAIHADNWKIAGCPVNGPSAAAIGDDLAVAWFTAADERPMIQLAFSDDGGATFSEPIRVDGGKGIGRVDVAMLEDRSVFVSWMEGAMIKAARLDRNGFLGESVLIASSSEARSGGFPQMTVSGNRLVFAWTDVESKSIRTAYLPL